jgi:hypothetical protein
MISDDRRCIFVHIPRCAGTSIEDVIWPGPRSEKDLWMGFVDRHHNRYQTGGLQHLRASQIRDAVGTARFDSYLKFAVVRNPFDRAVSQFSYMHRRPDLREFIGMDEDASFAEYLHLTGRRSHVQWEKQCSFLCDEDGVLLVDLIARYERLDEDMAGVFANLGLTGVELPRLNGTEHAPYREHYRPEVRRQVEERYRDDLDRFDYGF